ncbi:MAG: hypothetical protein HC851_05325 [Acaryochloris sp. RU_4_1]|nr:hypothetical protein [Acaryochloris sp. RU_4_1]NJN38759.1 hypothetical protein [Acaryochloridaceae cyanobacterium CSU_3_4]NJR57164.1 hypothetical protein [Acaryochloris sp. CRU_2_0]
MDTGLTQKTTDLSLIPIDLYLPLLNRTFLFSNAGTSEDDTHQLLALNGLACQLNQLLYATTDHHCAQNAVGVVIPENLTAVEAYQLGKELGQKEHQQFVNLTNIQAGDLCAPLFVLVNWWSQSYLAHYGQLRIDFTHTLDPYIGLEVLSLSPINLQQNSEQPSCAFYAGILAGFFSSLVGENFEVIEPDCKDTKPTICKFLLGHQQDLNALPFWQTVDRLSC